MKEHQLYCIYHNGKPLKSNQANIKRNAFDRAGSAKSIITTLVHEETCRRLEQELGPDYYYNTPTERWNQVETEVRSEYEIKEYVLNE